MAVGAWRVELAPDGSLRWLEPPESPPRIVTHDPDTSAWLRLLAKLLAPLTPDEML